MAKLNSMQVLKDFTAAEEKQKWYDAQSDIVQDWINGQIKNNDVTFVGIKTKDGLSVRLTTKETIEKTMAPIKEKVESVIAGLFSGKSEKQAEPVKKESNMKKHDCKIDVAATKEKTKAFVTGLWNKTCTQAQVAKIKTVEAYNVVHNKIDTPENRFKVEQAKEKVQATVNEGRTTLGTHMLPKDHPARVLAEKEALKKQFAEITAKMKEKGMLD